jgi:hypothetical protein
MVSKPTYYIEYTYMHKNVYSLRPKKMQLYGLKFVLERTLAVGNSIGCRASRAHSTSIGKRQQGNKKLKDFPEAERLLLFRIKILPKTPSPRGE